MRVIIAGMISLLTAHAVAVGSETRGHTASHEKSTVVNTPSPAPAFSISASTQDSSPQKPQTYLYEWYSPFSGVKTWSGDPPDYAGDVQPKQVCIWQESQSLGCVDYSKPENRQDLLNRVALQKQQAKAYEAYKIQAAAEQVTKQQKEASKNESLEVQTLRDKFRNRDMSRVPMGSPYSTVDRILEINELKPLAQKSLDESKLEIAQIVITRMQLQTTGIINPKTIIDRMVKSQDPAEKDLGERAQFATNDMGVSIFTLHDRDVASGIRDYVGQLQIALENARKLAAH